MKKDKTFIFDNDKNIYVVKLKQRKLWWLLLLMLIPVLFLLLTIEFQKEISLQTIDAENQQPLVYSQVYFTYVHTKLFDYRTFKFFKKDTFYYTNQTDEQGKVKFTTHYNLYSLIFGTAQASSYAQALCYASDTVNKNYFSIPYPWKIPLKTRYIKVDFYVRDSSVSGPIPDVEVNFKYYINGKEYRKTQKTAANGIVIFSVPSCIDSLGLNINQYGYMPFNFPNREASEILSAFSNRIISLIPIKRSINIFVYDLKTKKPIPNAQIQLNIKDGASHSLTTNTNGIGQGFFDSIGITKHISFHITHNAYHDTNTALYTVEEFSKFPDEKRTYYLRPLAHSMSFRNIDMESQQGLSGVQNIVYLNGDSLGIFYSNSEGYFTVPNLKKDDIISIKSLKSGYNLDQNKIKNRKIKELITEQSRTIALKKKHPKPFNVKPPRPNCRAHFSGTLLADKTVPGHISLIFKPDKYGEYVGEGMYPSSQVAFPNAVKYTFDAIAIDKYTRVIIYSEENFQGKILLDATGPLLINNKKWKNDSRINDFTTRSFIGGLESLFPKSCRKWSNSDMNDWAKGSIKIICQPH